MKYAVWISCVLLGSVLQAVLNNYLPVYLSPNLFLMFVMYMTFFYGYYTAVSAIIFISYLASVFSSGNAWFYIFSYLFVFYLLNIFRKFFDRTQAAAVIVLAAVTTLMYPFIVLLPSIPLDKTSMFKAAVVLAVKQLPINMAAAYCLFKYLPSLSSRFKSALNAQKV